MATTSSSSAVLGDTIYSRSAKNTILRSHGRPPWYTQNGKVITDAFVIGIAGGSASGKTHVAQQIVKELGSIPSVVILSQDSFYRMLTEEQQARAFKSEHDFDHPDSIESTLFASCLADLKSCKQANVPIYSFALHQRLAESKYLYGAAIIIAEGIMALNDPELRALYDLKVFVQCDSDLMLARRIKRDVEERGRSVSGILEQYLRYVKPSYDNFVYPSSKYADIIVPGHDNSVAIDLIVTHIRKKLDDRSTSFRSVMAKNSPVLGTLNLHAENIVLLDQTPQLRGIYTVLRDKNTPRAEFIFYADRLATLVIEKAMEQLPFRPHSVISPTGAVASGKQLDATVCGISIIRSGGPLERGLARVISDVVLGSLLIQTDPKSGEPMLLHASLPEKIRNRERAKDTYVFLLDAQIGSGASAMMAIRVLLDHGVLPEHIIFAAFVVAADGGIVTVRRAFPGVRIITGAIDAKLVEGWVGDPKDGRKVWNIVPGMGHIGDRYY